MPGQANLEVTINQLAESPDLVERIERAIVAHVVRYGYYHDNDAVIGPQKEPFRSRNPNHGRNSLALFTVAEYVRQHYGGGDIPHEHRREDVPASLDRTLRIIVKKRLRSDGLARRIHDEGVPLSDEGVRLIAKVQGHPNRPPSSDNQSIERNFNLSSAAELIVVDVLDGPVGQTPLTATVARLRSDDDAAKADEAYRESLLRNRALAKADLDKALYLLEGALGEEPIEFDHAPLLTMTLTRLTTLLERYTPAQVAALAEEPRVMRMTVSRKARNLVQRDIAWWANEMERAQSQHDFLYTVTQALDQSSLFNRIIWRIIVRQGDDYRHFDTYNWIALSTYACNDGASAPQDLDIRIATISNDLASEQPIEQVAYIRARDGHFLGLLADEASALEADFARDCSWFPTCQDLGLSGRTYHHWSELVGDTDFLAEHDGPSDAPSRNEHSLH